MSITKLLKYMTRYEWFKEIYAAYKAGKTYLDTKVVMVSKKKQKSSEETVLPPKRRKDEGARYYVPKAAFRQSLSE